MSLTNDHAALVIRAFKGISANPDQCFTCYDVTKATRSITDDNIAHHEVREFIHALYDQGLLNNYNRIDHTFWDVNTNQNVTAQLFVPPTGDPYAYDPNEVQMVKEDTDDEGEGPDILLEDGDGNPLITVSKKPTDEADVVSKVAGIDGEEISIKTNDSIVDTLIASAGDKIKKVTQRLPKWW